MKQIPTINEFISKDIKKQAHILTELFILKCTNDSVYAKSFDGKFTMSKTYFILRNFFLKKNKTDRIMLFDYLVDVVKEKELMTIAVFFKKADSYRKEKLREDDASKQEEIPQEEYHRVTIEEIMEW